MKIAKKIWTGLAVMFIGAAVAATADAKSLLVVTNNNTSLTLSNATEWINPYAG